MRMSMKKPTPSGAKQKARQTIQVIFVLLSLMNFGNERVEKNHWSPPVKRKK